MKNRKKYILTNISKYVKPKDSEILEIGIGKGFFGSLISSEFKSYSGIDIDKKLVDIAKKNISKNSKIKYKVGDALKIPFIKKFDILFYPFSWHFMKDFEKVLKESKRVLKPKGIVVILEPSENTTKWASPILTKDSEEFNKRIYNKKLKVLKLARKFLHSQKIFKIVRECYDKELKDYLFVLK